jgi:class 3 adenylate cyclase
MDTELPDFPTTTARSLTTAPTRIGTEHPSLLPRNGHLLVERTFIFSDLSGFTAFTKRNGPHASAAMLAKFRHVTRQIAASRGVRVAKWLGDGAMLVGVEPMPAIALGAHLVAHYRESEVGVRVGIASGTVLLFEGDDYIGEPVNLAAKLCAAAKPGEILADCASDGLPDWVHASDQVTVHVRGVGEVEGILRLVPAA